MCARTLPEMLSPTCRLHFLPPRPDRQLRPSTPSSARAQIESGQAASNLPRARRRSLADKCKACQRCQQSLRHIACAPTKVHFYATSTRQPKQFHCTGSRVMKIAGAEHRVLVCACTRHAPFVVLSGAFAALCRALLVLRTYLVCRSGCHSATDSKTLYREARLAAA